MITSDTGLKLIKAAESCVLTAYPDPASELGKACAALHLPLQQYTKVPRWQLLKADPVTIGWGTTGEGYRLGDKISQDIADSLLRVSIHFAEFTLSDYKGLNQNQFDALVSLIYNIGSKAFRASTLAMCLRRKDFAGAADQFLKWIHAGGTELPGLVNRRKAERALFLTPCHEEGVA